MKAHLISLWKAYSRFIDRQGFPMIVTVCVAVIAATALYSTKYEQPYVSPTPPVMENVSAAQLMQQSLRETATPLPRPTPLASDWHLPLDKLNVLRTFQAETMIQGSTTGIWSIHDAVDLGCSAGDKVYAIANGTILHAGQDALLGAWLCIQHPDNTEALYAGLAFTSDYIEGDQVFAGDTLGYAGKNPLDEEDIGPHLHLRVTKDGQAIDPLLLWTALN